MSPVTEVPRRVVVQDPRLAARRNEVARDQARRRLQLWGIAALLVVMALAAFGSTRSALLDIDGIVVVGADRSGVDLVHSTSGLEIGSPMVDADLRQARALVAELPWVAEVDIDRRWPGRVVIELVERVPVVVVAADEGGVFLVDAQGRLLERAPVPPQTAIDSGELVRLDGAVRGAVPGMELDEAGRFSVRVAASLTPALRARRPVVGFAEEAELRVVVAHRTEGDEGITPPIDGDPASRATILLGPLDDVTAKLASADAIFEQVDTRCVDVVDVRVPHSPVVTRHDEELCGT